MTNQTNDQSNTTFTNSRLRKTYWIAVTIIAISILFNNILINSVISSQKDDSSVINIAGRQRMLSQKLAKELILIRNNQGAQLIRKDLRESVSQWTKGHEFLLNGAIANEKKNTALLSLFYDIKTHYNALRAFAEVALTGNEVESMDLDAVQVEQKKYLAIMENIVSQYESDAKDKIKRLRRIEWWVTAFALLVLLLEIIFLFQPAARYMESLIENLSKEKKNYRTIAEENRNLLTQSENTLKELRSLNFAIDRTSLFASLKLDGEIIHISEKFKRLLNFNKVFENKYFHEVISASEGEQQYVKEILATPRSEIWTDEIQITTDEGKHIWLEVSIIPFNRDGIQQNMLILCNELTQRKEAFQEIERLSQQQFDAQIKSERDKAIQVMEAQEAERKRIAKDIHDGIGQMLTGLRFNLQAINLDKPEKARQKLEKIGKISTDLIKGVRMATFNLTPPELGDYGITTGLAKLTEGIHNLTGQEITFLNKTDFNQRFDFNVEINIYRIVQEAVNNAIKYANSDFILITCSHSKDMLSISVEDNGKGFDKSTITNSKNSDGSGMGLSFMKERVSYINGRIFISSAPNEGTKVTINIPL